MRITIIAMVLVLSALGIAAIVPRASAIPPTCLTEIPSVVGSDQVNMRGTMTNTGGTVPVSLKFRFGTSPSLTGPNQADYQAFPMQVSPGVAATTIGFNRTQYGLAPGMTYFYAAICTNTDGTSTSGAIVSFKTLASAQTSFLIVYLIIFFAMVVLSLKIPLLGIIGGILGLFLTFEIYTEYRGLVALAAPETLVPMTAILAAFSVIIMGVSIRRGVTEDEGFT